MKTTLEKEKPVMVITGTSRGLGCGIAQYFLDHGYRVAGCSRGTSTIHHESYQHSQVDISDERQVMGWVRQIKRENGAIDVLVCSAGVMNSFVYMSLTPGALLQSFLNINIAGTFYVCREVSKVMLQKRNGSIITISSIMTQLHEQGTSAYSASKSAITEMTKVLAKEIASMNINCNVISPSFMITDGTDLFSAEFSASLIEKQTIKRAVTIDEVCNVISFFSAPESRCITGQVINMGLVC